MKSSTIFYIVFMGFSLKPTIISPLLVCSLYGILTSLLYIQIASYCILSSVPIGITQVSETIYKQRKMIMQYMNHLWNISLSVQ